MVYLKVSRNTKFGVILGDYGKPYRVLLPLAEWEPGILRGP